MEDRTKGAVCAGAASGLLFLAGYGYAKIAEPLMDALYWKHQAKKIIQRDSEFFENYDAKYGTDLHSQYIKTMRDKGFDI